MKRTSAVSLSGLLGGLFGAALIFTPVGPMAAQQTPPAPSSSPQSPDATRPAIEVADLNQPAQDNQEVSSLVPPQSVVALAYAAKSKKPSTPVQRPS